ncbi:MAG: alpha/beta hydrolase [Ruminococcaceae bacterium]|nr:alpha/beta hydrolase [Oscillospiraceae bacterium]
MKHCKKALAVLLSVVLGLSCFCMVAFAETEKEKTESDIAFENLEKDIPLIIVTGLGGQFHSGLLTETEEDDVRIWEPTMEIIEPVIREYGFDLIKAILAKDYVQANTVLEKAADGVFGAFSCDANGVPDPDTGKKESCTNHLRDDNGYFASYDFLYDWRWDIVTIADRLHAYVQQIMELTGSDKVAFVGTSMGCSVLMTYLYKYFYTNEEYAGHIQSAVFVAGTMNGVATCQDPFSANISLDEEALVRYVEELAGGNVTILRALYSMGILNPVFDYAGELMIGLAENGLYDAIEDTLATIPGFHALMNAERYEEIKEKMYGTPEKQEKFAAILQAGDYFHNEVQANNNNIIQKLLDSGAHAAVFAEYGYNLMPLTSDNNRPADGTIALGDASFGATHSDSDMTLGEDYVQAVNCVCGKNHLSPDGQIDASTCAFADITWFGRDMMHTFSSTLLGKLIDLVTYSDEQITVHTYEDLPQFMINIDNTLVPLTEDNFGEIIEIEKSIENDAETAKMVKTVKLIIAAVIIILVALCGLIVFGIVKSVKKRKAKKAK